MAERRSNKQNYEAGLILGGLEGMEAWAALVAQRASTSPLMPVDTSRLATSIIKDPEGAKFVREGNSTTFTHRVGSGLEYAGAQEMGSGLYNEWEGEDARPRRKYAIVAGALQDPPLEGGKKALAFNWKNAPAGMVGAGKDGKFIFTFVMHPGVRPRRFLRTALRETNEEGRGLVITSMLNQMERMSR